MTTGPENVQAVVPQSSIVGTGSCDPSGGNDNKGFAATYEMRLLVAACSAYAHGFGQVPTQAIVNDIKGSEKNMSNINPISGRAETAVNAIGTANTAIVHLDTISSTYLQPLHAFNVVVTSIADVRVENNDVLFGSTIMHRSIHTPKWRWLY